MEKYKEELRDSRGFGWLAGLSLDLKLAARMLIKYPGLTLVSVAGGKSTGPSTRQLPAVTAMMWKAAAAISPR